MENALRKNFSLIPINKVYLQKKSTYSKNLVRYVLILKSVLTERGKFRELSLFFKKKSSNCISKKGILILHYVCFSFSAINTFLHIVDTEGRLKFSVSAGLLGFKGKSKKSRFQVLKMFFRELRRVKSKFLKNNPVSLHLNNVGFYKRIIIRRLKKKLFIKTIKNYQPYSYNGCRKKKKSRK